jgi:hypothetical protein
MKQWHISWSSYNSIKGVSLIISHAGGEIGFVPTAPLRWKSHQAAGDYHHQMNQQNYEKWVREKLVPNLRPNSVVVLDNTPYHNLKINKVPNSNSTEQYMRGWLQREGIPFIYDT